MKDYSRLDIIDAQLRGYKHAHWGYNIVELMQGIQVSKEEWETCGKKTIHPF